VVDPNGGWCLRTSNSAGLPDVSPFLYGLPGWTPVVGAWASASRPSPSLDHLGRTSPSADQMADSLVPGSRLDALDQVFAQDGLGARVT
jgi:hypothetical protein